MFANFFYKLFTSKTKHPTKEESIPIQNTNTNTNTNNNNNNNNNNSNSSNKTRTEKDYYGVALAIWNGNYGWGSGNTRKTNLKAKGFDVDKMQDIINKIGKDGYIHSGKWSGKYHGITSLSPYHYNKFASGVRNVGRDQWALTQEKGMEMIVRPSDGAILTPIARNDSVLNSSASNNIWEMANDPAKFIKENIGFGEVVTPVVQSMQSNYTQHLDKVVFNMPNVKNYDEFLVALKDDRNFERLITSMTIDKIVGKSSLIKGKSIR